MDLVTRLEDLEYLLKGLIQHKREYRDHEDFDKGMTLAYTLCLEKIEFILKQVQKNV